VNKSHQKQLFGNKSLETLAVLGIVPVTLMLLYRTVAIKLKQGVLCVGYALDELGNSAFLVQETSLCRIFGNKEST
jgi:hypothetical protein